MKKSIKKSMLSYNDSYDTEFSEKSNYDVLIDLFKNKFNDDNDITSIFVERVVMPYLRRIRAFAFNSSYSAKKMCYHEALDVFEFGSVFSKIPDEISPFDVIFNNCAESFYLHDILYSEVSYCYSEDRCEDVTISELLVDIYGYDIINDADQRSKELSIQDDINSITNCVAGQVFKGLHGLSQLDSLRLASEASYYLARMIRYCRFVTRNGHCLFNNRLLKDVVNNVDDLLVIDPAWLDARCDRCYYVLPVTANLLLIRLMNSYGLSKDDFDINYELLESKYSNYIIDKHYDHSINSLFNEVFEDNDNDKVNELKKLFEDYVHGSYHFVYVSGVNKQCLEVLNSTDNKFVMFNDIPSDHVIRLNVLSPVDILLEAVMRYGKKHVFDCYSFVLSAYREIQRYKFDYWMTDSNEYVMNVLCNLLPYTTFKDADEFLNVLTVSMNFKAIGRVCGIMFGAAIYAYVE